MRRAAHWYERASTYAPVCYSWPHKGLIKCLLVEGNTSDALRHCADFVARAQDLVAKHSENPNAALFLTDTACFAGRVAGFARAVSAGHDSVSLLSRDMAAKFSASEASVFENAESETLAHYRESVGGSVPDRNQIVWHLLGDSVAQERMTLLESIGNRSSNRVCVKMVASVPPKRNEGMHEHALDLPTAPGDFLITESRNRN